MKKKNEIFFFIFLPIKKKGIITFWPFDRGGEGGTKRRLRGNYQLSFMESLYGTELSSELHSP